MWQTGYINIYIYGFAYMKNEETGLLKHQKHVDVKEEATVLICSLVVHALLCIKQRAWY